MTDRWKYFLEFQNQRHELQPEQQVVGRSRKCDLSIPDPSASRKHVVLTPGEGLIALEDLGSSNGTFINGERIQGTGILRHGDRLGLGDAEVQVVIEAALPLETVRLPTDDLAVPDAGVGEATTMLQAASVRLAQDAIGQPPTTAGAAIQELDPQSLPTSGSHMAPPPVAPPAASSGQHMAPPPTGKGSGQHMEPPTPEGEAPEPPAPGDPLRTARLDTASLAGAIPPSPTPRDSGPQAENPLATTVLPTDVGNKAGADPLLTARLDAQALREPTAGAADPRQTTRIDTSQYQAPEAPPTASELQTSPAPHPGSPEFQALQTSRLSPEQLRAVQDQLAPGTGETPPVETEPGRAEAPTAELVPPQPIPDLAIPQVPSFDPEPVAASEPAEAFEPPPLEAPSQAELSPDIDLPSLEAPDIELPPELQPEPAASTEPSFAESAEVPSFDLPTMDLPAFEAPDAFPAPPTAFDAPLPGGRDLPSFEAPDFGSTPTDLPALDLEPPAVTEAPPLEPALSAPSTVEPPAAPPTSFAPPAVPPPPAPAAKPKTPDSSFGQGAYVPPPAPTPLDVPVPDSAIPDLRDLAAQKPMAGDGEMLPSLEGFDTTLGPGAELPPSMQRAQENMARTREEAEVEQAPAASNPYVSPEASKPPAGFFIRAVAVILDSLWMGALSAAAAAVPLFLADVVPAEIGGLPVAALLGTGVLVFNLLVVLIGWSVWGRTPGKKLTGLAVCDAQGKPGIGFAKALVRLFGYFLSSLLLGIGHLLALGKSRKALHDHLAGTTVRKI